MAFRLSNVINTIKQRVRIPDRHLPEEERINSVRQAVEKYSIDRPLRRADVVSGLNPFALPANFSVGVSTIQEIESPIGSNPPIYVREERDYEVIETAASGTRILFISFEPDIPFLVIYKAEHSLEDLALEDDGTAATVTTIPTAHQQAFMNLACHFAAQSVAAAFAGTETNPVTGDARNFRTKEQEWGRRADKFFEKYLKVVPADDQAAIEYMDSDVPNLLDRVPRLWHNGRRIR